MDPFIITNRKLTTTLTRDALLPKNIPDMLVLDSHLQRKHICIIINESEVPPEASRIVAAGINVDGVILLSLGIYSKFSEFFVAFQNKSKLTIFFLILN